MRVLIIGGTGLISVGIVRHLLAIGHDVTMFNRGKRDDGLPAEVRREHGDRDQPGAFDALAAEGFDCVIDMICFTPKQAQASIAAFAGHTQHFQFCSTVCTYGIKIPPGAVIDETFPQEPTTSYGRDKLECERLFLEAAGRGLFKLTIVRPSSTYGPGGSLIDQLEGDPVSWGRIERGLPVLCAGDGLGLWNATHRDDCGKLFAGAVGNEKTFGQSYNATRQEIFTWTDYFREGAAALGKTANLIYMPADWIVARDPKRFSLLREITRYHGPYTSAKAMADMPGFRCEIDFATGAAETLDDLKRRGKFKTGEGDEQYQSIVDAALATGAPVVEV